MSNLQIVFERWTTDAEFKKNFKLNPKKALEVAGIQLSDNDLQKVLASFKQQEELEKKINK